MNADQPVLLKTLHWLGHDSYRIDQPSVIYIDPWRLPPGSPAADLILVSHDHFDHCSPEDVESIRKEDTVVVAQAAAAAKLRAPVRVLQVGKSVEAAGVRVEAVPAYNLDKKFHPKAEGHLGFVLQLGGERLYFAGDTDLIPEMETLVCDVALLPVSGTYVMTADEAVRAAGLIRTRVAVPMHYGAGVAGTEDDAEAFRRGSPVPVVVLPMEGKPAEA
ncbi:MAG TPA: MBL fold metallo-hydrolase [Anaerolineales bacterium]|nr:MBL fold metallo-hydrolase [Anaerolineales bacterium]